MAIEKVIVLNPTAVSVQRDLAFATDKVDVSGSNVNVTGNVGIIGTPNVNITNNNLNATMTDVFMALRLLASYLQALPLAIDPNSRLRTNIEIGNLTSIGTITTLSTLTNIVQMGGHPVCGFEIMNESWNACIRNQII